MDLLLSHFLVFFLLRLPFSAAQQQYENNRQNECYTTNGSSTSGYVCNGNAASCASFLLFRSHSPYQSPLQISSLLSASAANISSLNSLSSPSSSLPAGSELLVPVPCSCSSGLYQHNASYTLKSSAETYQIIANDTFSGLSTCQALMAQNPAHESTSLVPGINIVVPLRCACPTAAQVRDGFKYLLTYVITWGDDVPTIANRFSANADAVWTANSLTSGATIFPFTTLLIPLQNPPSKLQPSAPRPPPPPFGTVPTEQVSGGGGGGGSDHKGVIIGAVVGAVAFLALCALMLWFFYRVRRTKSEKKRPDKEFSVEYGELPSKSLIIANDEIRAAVESLTVYKYEELRAGGFDENHRIKGSVFRGTINGDEAVVKKVDGDVSNEISILTQINHSSIIRLSGICLHEGSTFLVYEFAENGSLSDWLPAAGKNSDDRFLTWKQRIQIAYDVADGLNYLHNYAKPPYIHKDLKSSNILLDGEFRAKIANFRFARQAGSREEAQLTRHVAGTHGYMAPEYIEHGLVTPKLDVFSFGVVLLQLLSGKEATFPKSGKGEELLAAEIEGVVGGEDVQRKMREFVDPSLREEYPFDLAYAVAQLAARCVAEEPAERPEMPEVMVTLSAVYNTSLDWDPSSENGANSGSIVHGR